jgi:hypothetical protein
MERKLTCDKIRKSKLSKISSAEDKTIAKERFLLHSQN